MAASKGKGHYYTHFLPDGRTFQTAPAANGCRAVLVGGKRVGYLARKGKLFVAPDGCAGERVGAVALAWLERAGLL